MVRWIVLGVLAVVVLFGAAVLRAMWKESAAKIDALPPKNVRRTWPLPTTAGQRVMWCPILASKVVLADTKVEEGTLGAVVRVGDDGHPVLAFDGRHGEPHLVDKWGAARVVPPEHDRRPVTKKGAKGSRTTPPRGTPKARRRR